MVLKQLLEGALPYIRLSLRLVRTARIDSSSVRTAIDKILAKNSYPNMPYDRRHVSASTCKVLPIMTPLDIPNFILVLL